MAIILIQLLSTNLLNNYCYKKISS